MKISIHIEDATEEMLERLAGIASKGPRSVISTFGQVATKLGGFVPGEPVTGVAEVHSDEGTVWAAKPSSTTQDTPLGKEGTGFAAPKQAVDPDAPKRGRGRPPKNPVVTMPNGVVLNAPVVEAEPEPTDVSVMEPEPEPEPVKAEPTPEDTIKAYFDRFKVAGFRALLNREGVAKFGELTDGRREVCLTEMRDALEMDVPVVAP